jgi:hypothetical protein
MKRVDTSWSEYTGNYSQREVEDKAAFDRNYERIFGKKTKERENANNEDNTKEREAGL